MSSKPSKWLFDSRRVRRTTRTEFESVFCRWIYFHVGPTFKNTFLTFVRGEGAIAPLWIHRWSQQLVSMKPEVSSLYRVGPEKRGHRLMTIILSDLNRFRKKITGRFLSKFAVKWILKLPPTAPCIIMLLHYLVKH